MINVGYIYGNYEKNIAGINKSTQATLNCLGKYNKELQINVLGENFLDVSNAREIVGICDRNDKCRKKELYAQSKIYDIDIVHSVYFPIEDIPNVKKVLTIHDLTPLINPKWFDNGNVVEKMFQNDIRHSIEIADAIIAVSEATKRDILKFYDADENKIKVVYWGIDNLSINVSIEDIEKIKMKYGIVGRYMVSVSTLSPRKNMESLIRAFTIYRQRYKKSDLKLVLTGKKGWLEQSVFEAVRDSGIEKDIIFTGYISNYELSALYSGMLFSAYVSLYEGFGLPILETLSYGKTVLSSDTSSMPEVGGEAVCYCNPYDVESICEGITKLVENSDYRLELEKKALKQFQRFSYENTAKEYFNIYKEIIGRK